MDVILGQPTVGTVIKIENDEDDGIYSIVTALNLGRYKVRSQHFMCYIHVMLRFCHHITRPVMSNLASESGDASEFPFFCPALNMLNAYSSVQELIMFLVSYSLYSRRFTVCLALIV